VTSFRVRRTAERVAARQRGVAAIEFALVFSVLFLAVYGVITFGGVLYVQQVISRAAEDGARAAQLSQTNTAPETLKANVLSAIYRSISLSSITPAAAGTTASSKEVWIRSKMPPPDVVVTPGKVVIKVTYPYSANPRLPALPFTQSWMPANLSGKATAATPS